MRSFVPGFLFLAFTSAAVAQVRNGPYGPVTSGVSGPAVPLYSHPSAGSGHSNNSTYGRRNYAPPAGHSQHGPTVIVPYPLYYGSYDSGVNGYVPPAGDYGNAAPNGYADPNAPPSVVINQGYAQQPVNPMVREYDGGPDGSSGMHLYEGPTSHPYADAMDANARTERAEQPTLYLIAFKDHTVIPALGYWMEGSTLHYVSVEHTLNQASIDLIDRDLSSRLNDERGLDFRLPGATPITAGK